MVLRLSLGTVTLSEFKVVSGVSPGDARKCLPGALERRVGERGCAPRAEAVGSVSQSRHLTA